MDNPPHTSYFSEIHLIGALTWPFVVVETSKKTHSIGDWQYKALVPLLIVESDWKETTMPTISPNTSNQSFGIAILFSVVKRSGNYVFQDDNPPTVLWASVVSCALGHIRFPVERGVVQTSERAHWIGNQISLIPFLRFKVIGGWVQPSLPPPPHSHTNTYTTYFPKMHLIAILRQPFVVVETSRLECSFDRKLKGSFLIVKSDWRATSPSPSYTPISTQNTSNQNL